MKNVTIKNKIQKNYIPESGEKSFFVLFEMVGDQVEVTKRVPLNLSLVLDRSGSMHGRPLELCKEAVKYVIGKLSDKDILSLVVFDNEVQTTFSPQRVTNKEHLFHKVDTIQTGGMTNLCGGLVTGAEHVLNLKTDEFVNRVVILSDGQANEGITNPDEMYKITSDMQKKGLSFTTMGVSNHFNEELMAGIANNGIGNYYYIPSVDKIPSVFQKELQSLFTVIAKDITLTLKMKNGVKIENVFGYSFQGEGDTVKLALGDLFAGDKKSVLMECTIPNAMIGSLDLFDVEWSFLDVASDGEEKSVPFSKSVEVTNDESKLSEAEDQAIAIQREITMNALVLEEALKDMDNGDISTGQEKILSNARRMKELGESLDNEELILNSSRAFEQMKNFTFDAKSRKELHFQKEVQMKRNSKNN